MRVLIADDSSTDRLVLQTWVRQWGFDPEPAEDGDAAWSALTRPDGPRLALLDWVMPGRDGPTLCRQLRQVPRLPYTYLVVLTAKGRQEDAVTALDAGADDFLVKPLERAVLRSRLAAGVRVLDYEARLADRNRRLELYAAEMRSLADHRAGQLVHADRMATLGTMAAGMAHEINNPTTFISGNVQVLERFWEALAPALAAAAAAPASDPRLAFVLAEMPGALAGIRQGVARIAQIVAGLRIYTRRDTGSPAPYDLAACLEGALAMCRHALRSGIRVVTDCPPGLPPGFGMVSQVQQVLVNLIGNAADAMAAQGGGELRVAIAPAPGHLRLTVEDSGPGIPPDALPRIFDPFFTTKAPGQGTGLGLSISAEIVKQHGGAIQAANRPGGGACFTLELPIALEEPAYESAAADCR